MATQADSRATSSSRQAPLGAPVEAQCRHLREQLGAFGYQWLCAAAVYPRLRFPLSLYLGAVIAAELKRPPPGEDDQFALFRLPWFRHGWLPEDLRLALIADLEPRLAPAVRSAIERALYSAAIGDTDLDAPGPVPLEEPPLRWRSMLHAYWEAASPDAPERDRIFIRYMKGRAVTADAIARTRRFERLLGPHLAALLQHGRPLLAAAALACVAAALTADDWLRPSLERQQQRAVPAEERVEEERAEDLAGETPVSPKLDEGDPTADPTNVAAPAPPVAKQLPPADEPVNNKVVASTEDPLPPDCQFSPYSTCGASPGPLSPTIEKEGPTGSPSGEQTAKDPMAAYRAWQNILRVQRALEKEGVYKGDADGMMGEATEAAIRRYQEQNGLSVTGKIDDTLLQSLGLAPKDSN